MENRAYMAMIKACDYVDVMFEIAYDNSHVTINEGRNGKMYAWYGCEYENVLVDVDTLEILNSSMSEKELNDFIDEQFC